MAEPWTVASAIAPTGEFGKVWLAAHWDRKLKKEDFLETRIPDIVVSILKKSDKLTLRYMGNFLLGLCKVYGKQCFYFEEHTRQMHDNLMLAFSNKDFEREKRPKPDAQDANADPESEALVADEELERLLASRRHLAPLEEITLKPAMEEYLAGGSCMQIDTFGATSEMDQAALRKLQSFTKRALGQAMPLLPASNTLEPLVEIPREESSAVGALGDADGLGPLDIDLHPVADGDIVMGEGGALVPAPDGGPVVGEGGGGGDGEKESKRRRKAFTFDDPPEIPKEVYQGYMNDRSAITKKEEGDSTILLPHNHPMMPHFMTTYTDMCSSLRQGLQWGTQVAERRRAVLQQQGAPPLAPEPPEIIYPGLVPLGADGGAPEVPAPEDPQGAAPVVAVERWEPPIIPVDISDAPSNMGLVVKGNADQEDEQPGLGDARLGYSWRTEKMHKLLAKEFHGSKKETPNLSYEQMCRKQSGGDRGVIAGCFFELLVLRTNGVVNLSQETPYADIKIEKARAWGPTTS